MGEFARELPRKVQQYKEGRFTCWAAALESWMSVTPQSPASWRISTQDDAIDDYYMFMESNGALEIQWGFRFMAAGVGMEFKVCKPATKLSGALIYEKLKNRGHIYLFYAGGMTMASGQIGHCVVIYAVTDPWSGKPLVSYMDPWFGDYKVREPLSYFQNAKEAVVGWFEYTA